jgi:hypothetical protein
MPERGADAARRFLRRRLGWDVGALVIAVALVVTGVLLLRGIGWPAVVLIVVGVLVSANRIGSLVARRGTGLALREPSRRMTAARFARRRVVLRDGRESTELRVYGQAARLPADDDAAVRVFRHGSTVVAVAAAAVVYGRVPGGRP